MNKYLYLEIRDSGCGIDKEIETRIFDPFFSTKTERNSNSGSGLGLSNVYRIIKNNNGKIEVESEIGKGSTFKIYLPSNE